MVNFLFKLDVADVLKTSGQVIRNELTLPVPISDEEKKLSFYFTTSLKGFMKKCENKNLI